MQFDPKTVPPELWAVFTEGARFEVEQDPEDLRFDIVRLRVPARVEATAAARRSFSMRGQTATEEVTTYYLAQAAQVLRQLQADELALAVESVAAAARTILRARRRERDARA